MQSLLVINFVDKLRDQRLRLGQIAVFLPPGRRWRTEVAPVLATVRRSNVVCGFPAPRFHEGALLCAAIEGISLTR